MKIFLKEFAHNYKKYLFGYTKLALREEEDIADDLYQNGFLPFTGNLEIKNTYYMARSCRIDLEKFKVSSENRRVQKKFLDEPFLKTKASAENYINNEDFSHFCLEYFLKRHGENIFFKDRLQFVLNFSKEVYVIKYSNRQGKAVAYVIETMGKQSAQYWFSFYDINLASQSFGTWLMLDCIVAAKEKKINHYYLGTIYGEKALYKTNFNALEYWDGNTWQQDISDLKKLAREDKYHKITN